MSARERENKRERDIGAVEASQILRQIWKLLFSLFKKKIPWDCTKRNLQKVQLNVVLSAMDFFFRREDRRGDLAWWGDILFVRFPSRVVTFGDFFFFSLLINLGMSGQDSTRLPLPSAPNSGRERERRCFLPPSLFLFVYRKNLLEACV